MVSARFCNVMVLLSVVWVAFPQASIQEDMWGWIIAKYSVLKLATGRKCLACLIMNRTLDILLLI